MVFQLKEILLLSKNISHFIKVAMKKLKKYMYHFIKYSIPGRFIPKTQKWYLMPLSIIRYGSRVSGAI